MIESVPEVRRRALNDEGHQEEGTWVLYWMVAHRRPTYNFALQRAVELAQEWGRPLLILEGLRHGYEWACDRFHAFILEGMAHNQQAFEGPGVRYMPFVEREDRPGEGLLESLSKESVAVVVDDFPAFFLPRMVEAAGKKVEVAMEAVDSNGYLPMRGTEKKYKRAYDFRRYLHKEVVNQPPVWPKRDPLEALDVRWGDDEEQVLASIQERWPQASPSLLSADREALSELPIDHDIAPNADFPGGLKAARERLSRFMEEGLRAYHERRNDVSEAAESGLSPYLHFGHISTHRLFSVLVDREGWTLDDVDADRISKREGFWQMSEGGEAFADQILTWREVGFNRCVLDPEGYDQYDTLPEWARTTMAEHADDERPFLYSLEEFEAAQTHDELWNAAQNQLVETGVMHNYLRMLWGKKIFHWSESPREALSIMVELNNKYALDGRDPNSYNGIFWVLGRFDRAWGPEREVFGKIRYMTSRSTRRKFKVDAYIERFEGSV